MKTKISILQRECYISPLFNVQRPTKKLVILSPNSTAIYIYIYKNIYSERKKEEHWNINPWIFISERKEGWNVPVHLSRRFSGWFVSLHGYVFPASEKFILMRRIWNWEVHHRCKKIAMCTRGVGLRMNLTLSMILRLVLKFVKNLIVLNMVELIGITSNTDGNPATVICQGTQKYTQTLSLSGFVCEWKIVTVTN